MVISCKYWHLCRPVPGLLHPLARVRKFESDIISSERGTDRNPSPFLPVWMCVYGNCVVYSGPYLQQQRSSLFTFSKPGPHTVKSQ